MSAHKKVNVDIKSQKDFFKRGKEIARLADKGHEIPHETTIWFENVIDFNKFISEKKIQLLTQIREEPCSITELATLVKRNRTAVTRDVNELEKSGLVLTQMVTNRGHGKVRVVKPIAKHLILQIKI